MRNLILSICLLSLLPLTGEAQSERIPLLVNNEVTTHIVMPEDIRLVDISTDKVVGNQCANNIVRIKPANAIYNNGFLGTVTVIGERHIAQFNIYGSPHPNTANSSFFVKTFQMQDYENPDVSMTRGDMAKISWNIFSSNRKFFNIHAKNYGIKITVNNIYTVNDKFFIDFSLTNKSKIKYDIDEIRIKLTDKKETKATNSQTVELTPVFSLNQAKSFKRSYRNVIVVDKLTFPDEKVLRLEISEKQISGRTINVPIEYADILHADCIVNN